MFWKELEKLTQLLVRRSIIPGAWNEGTGRDRKPEDRGRDNGVQVSPVCPEGDRPGGQGDGDQSVALHGEAMTKQKREV